MAPLLKIYQLIFLDNPPQRDMDGERIDDAWERQRNDYAEKEIVRDYSDSVFIRIRQP